MHAYYPTANVYRTESSMRSFGSAQVNVSLTRSSAQTVIALTRCGVAHFDTALPPAYF